MSTSTTPYPSNTVPSIRHAHVVPRRSPPHKFLEGLQNQDIVWDATNIARQDLLFVRNCSGGSITIQSPFTKILIEQCDNLTINLQEKVMTNMLEIWKCKNVVVHIGHDIFTAQVDMCDNVALNFGSPTNYQQVVWSYSDNISVNFRDTPTHNTTIGLTLIRQMFSDIRDSTDQFYLRFIDNVLTSEVLVRLPGGFPTTNREADLWDAQHPHEPKLF